MAEVTMRVCDRKGCENSERTDRAGSTFRKLTVHGHHNRGVELCHACADAFEKWLNRDLLVHVDPRRAVE